MAGVFGLNQEQTIEELVSIRRRELRGLLTSYADEADIFTEIIQNSFDSVQTAVDMEHYKSGRVPQICIVIGRRGSDDTNYFAVYDNGLGMEPNIASRFTVPGWGANKRKGKTLGYKGVGASFFVAASEKFAVWSRGSESKTETSYTIHGAWSWITKETEPEPTVTEGAELPYAVKSRVEGGPGTAVCYYLHAGAKPKTLNLVLADEDASTEIGRWVSFLCSKSALGALTDIGPEGIQVKVVLDRGAEDVTEQSWTFGDFSLQDRKLGYPYPRQVYKNAKNIDDIENLATPRRDALNQTLPAVYLRWSAGELKEKEAEFYEKLSLEEKELFDEHLEFVDVFYGYSTKVIKGITDRLGTRSDVIRYGIKIGVDGVPQGRTLDFSFTSSIGLERQMHAVISFKKLELDIGRKIPADETVNELVAAIGNRLQSVLLPYRIYLKKDDKPGPSVDLASWRISTTGREEHALTRKMFHAWNLEPVIRVDPDNENDTIALFSGLLTNGLIRGLCLRALSGINQYDGLVDIDVASPGLKDISDPLSIGTENSSYGGDMKVLEFKHTFDDLMIDFLIQRKNAADIDIVVVWDFNNLSFRRGTIDYWFADQAGLREVHSATHVWRDDNNTTAFPIISLRHVVAILLACAEKRSGEPATGVATLNLLHQEVRDALV